MTSDELDFLNPLAQDIALQVAKSFFESLHNIDFKSFDKLTRKVTDLKDLGWSKSSWDSRNLSNLIFSKKGIMLLDTAHLVQAKPVSLQFIVCNDKLLNNQSKLNKFFTDFSYVHLNKSNTNGQLSWVRDFFELRDGHKNENQYGKILYKFIKGSRLFIRKKIYKEICKPGALPATFKRRLKVAWENSDWYLIENGIKDDLPPFDNIEELVDQIDKDKLYGVIYHYFDWNIDTEIEEKDEDEFSIAEAWLELNDGKAYFKT